MNQNVQTTSNVTFDGGTFGKVNTGQGWNELYDMDQNVLTTSTPSFTSLTAKIGWTNLTGYPGACSAGDYISGIGDTITCGTPSSASWVTNATTKLNMMGYNIMGVSTLNTGQGAYELYAMNQDVESSDAVTFASLDTGQGANELYDMNQNVQTTSNVTFDRATVTGLKSGLVTPPSDEDHTYSGEAISAVAGQAVAIGDVCYLKSDGKFWKANATLEATSDSWLVLATATISENATGVFLIQGLYRDNTWDWTTIGTKLYVSITPGNPTSTAPSGSLEIVRIIGYAYTADVIMFNPDKIYIEMI
jgi:hypothetical protein